jgi:hypothetical protein
MASLIMGLYILPDDLDQSFITGLSFILPSPPYFSAAEVGKKGIAQKDTEINRHAILVGITGRDNGPLIMGSFKIEAERKGGVVVHGIKVGNTNQPFLRLRHQTSAGLTYAG